MSNKYPTLASPPPKTNGVCKYLEDLLPMYVSCLPGVSCFYFTCLECSRRNRVDKAISENTNRHRCVHFSQQIVSCHIRTKKEY